MIWKFLSDLRVVVGIVVIICAHRYVRQQYRTVTHAITAKAPAPFAKEHDGWKACATCRGRGKVSYWDASGVAQTNNCISCNGTGWMIDWEK